MWLIIISVIVLPGAVAVLAMGLRTPGLVLLATGVGTLCLGILVLIGQNRPDDAEKRDRSGQAYYLSSGVPQQDDAYRSVITARDETRLAQWSDSYEAGDLSSEEARSIGLAIINQADMLSQERGADAPYGSGFLQSLIRDRIIKTGDLVNASAMSGSLCILPQQSRIPGGIDISIKLATEWQSGQGNSSVVPDVWGDGALSEESGPYIEFRWKDVFVDGKSLEINRATSSDSKTLDELYERQMIQSSRVRPFSEQPMTQIVSFPFVPLANEEEPLFSPGPHLFKVRAEVTWFDGPNDNATVVAVVPLEATRILSVPPSQR
tara:strand:+ start:1249 stop:2211 length:963 start_codon:yes stop_codon:yes gene_type:complete